VGAELAIATAGAAEEPASAPGSRAAGAGNQSSDFLGKALPNRLYGVVIKDLFKNKGQTAAAPYPGSVIYWRPGDEIWHEYTLGGDMIHELLHNMGFSDAEMHKGLGLDKLPGYNPGFTDDISRRFAADFFGKKF
jgi:hypothetical protein